MSEKIKQLASFNTAKEAYAAITFLYQSFLKANKRAEKVDLNLSLFSKKVLPDGKKRFDEYHIRCYYKDEYKEDAEWFERFCNTTEFKNKKFI